MQRARSVAVFALCALLASSACGARWNDEQRAAATGANGGVSGSGASGATAAGSTGSGGVAAAGGTAAGGSSGGSTGGVSATGGGTGQGSTGAGTDPAAVGTGGAPTGDGGGVAVASGPAPCAAPSDAPGVSDTTITLGTISTQSGPVPGLGASALAAVQAYVAYRNSTGGVCGRQLELRSADDGTDNGRFRSALNELSADVLGFVGGVGGGDAGGADLVDELAVPFVNTPISETFEGAASVFDVNPPFADVNQSVPKFDWLYEQGVRTAALVYIAADQTRSEVQGKQKPQLLAAGIQVVNEQELPLSTLSFDSAARAVANSGADYLLFVSDAGQSASMARSMADAGADIMFAEYLVAYGSAFVDLAGDTAEGTTSWIRSLPNEDGAANPEQQAFLSWMDQVAPGVVTDTFAADSWASAKAFVDALAALPGPITRDAVTAQLHSMTTYDAGGFIGPINLGEKLNNGCVIGMIVEGGQWRRLVPDTGFLC